MNNKERVRTIEYQLIKSLQPDQLIVSDDSAAHIGHAGAQSGAGHFSVVITAKNFDNKSLPERHRMVYAAVSDLMDSEIHALSIQAKAPSEV
jgi:BolA family transcriptional regulator, general stress-responsive regulator